MTEKQIYLIVAACLIGIDWAVAGKTFASHRKNVQFLAMAALTCGLAELFYTLGLFTHAAVKRTLVMGVFYSCIPVMLMMLLLHFLDYIEVRQGRARSTCVIICWAVTAADVLLELTNAFTGLVIGLPASDNASGYDLAPKLLYRLHLYWCYVIIAGIVALLVYKILQTSRIYRRKYYTVIGGLVFAVAINGVCLVFQNSGMLDYSQASYTALAVILYWDVFYNSERGLQTLSHQVIMDELVHPVLLFGENNRLTARNKSARFLVPEWHQGMELTLPEFLARHDLDAELAEITENRTFQWVNGRGMQASTYRVDGCVIRDERRRVIGRMFVFTDNSLGVDLLTGFMSHMAFERFVASGQGKIFPPDSALAVVDINRLSEFNRTHGRDAGDACLRFLASSLRQHCGGDAVYARLADADLLVICPNCAGAELRRRLAAVREECASRTGDGVPFEVQSAIVEMNEAHELADAVKAGTYSMRSRKLMDHGSAHSSLLDSIKKTLEEADGTTEAHVERTQKMGELLGRRLGLSDLQQSNLSLLCLLHDIGKLGIPVELLNKPGKLTRYEWEIMRSHVYKGYRIAKASPELTPIADLILHHHESWDGKGYPDGLEKESIPLLSRIIAVVDSYDAMINDRPYRRGIPEAAARKELLRCAGTQFDPLIVSEYLRLLDELRPAAASGAAEKPAAQAGKETLPGEKAPEGQAAADRPETGSGRVQMLPSVQVLLDADYSILSAGPELETISGYQPEDIAKYRLTFGDLLFPEDAEACEKQIESQLRTGGYAMLEHLLRRKDGSYRNVMTYLNTHYSPERNNARYIARILDASDTLYARREAENARRSMERQKEQWKKQLRLDPMTGLLNHQAFIDDAELALLKETRPMLLAILDVDRFKEYNDTNGHPEGDRLLSLLARALQTASADSGFSGRTGGDEFAAFLVLPETDGTPLASAARSRVQVLYDAVEQAAESSEFGASISLGACLIPPDSSGRNFSAAYRAADEALYAAKQRGRRRFAMADGHGVMPERAEGAEEAAEAADGPAGE